MTGIQHVGRCHFLPLRPSEVIPGGVVCRCRCGRIRVKAPEGFTKRSA